MSHDDGELTASKILEALDAGDENQVAELLAGFVSCEKCTTRVVLRLASSLINVLDNDEHCLADGRLPYRWPTWRHSLKLRIAELEQVRARGKL